MCCIDSAQLNSVQIRTTAADITTIRLRGDHAAAV